MRLKIGFSNASITRCFRNTLAKFYDGLEAAGDFTAGMVSFIVQAAPTAKTVSSTLTAAQLLNGIITVNQGAGAASEQTLPTGALMDAALPGAVANDSFDFYVINISTTDADDASILVGDGWTLVGDITIPARSAAGSLNCSAHFRARKTGTATWTLYRLA